MSGILRLLFVFCFLLYGYGFLSLRFTDRRDILHAIDIMKSTAIMKLIGVKFYMAVWLHLRQVFLF